MEPIDREALLKAVGIDVESDGNQRAAQVLECILNAPIVDAAPVVHSQWEECDDDVNTWIRCPECGFEQDIDYCGDHPHEIEDYKVCPSCGARMDLPEGEEEQNDG